MSTHLILASLATVLMSIACRQETSGSPPVLVASQAEPVAAPQAPALPAAPKTVAAAPQIDAASKPDAGKSSHERMVAALKNILDRTDDENGLLGGFRMRNLRKALDNMPETAPRINRFRLLVELGDATVYYGNEREGLGYFQKAFDMGPEEIPADTYQDSKIRFAAAWLRLAETENCCASHNSQSCILPLQGAAIHTKKEGSTNAVKLLSEVLAATEKTSPTHLRAQWMLNMGWWTLGGYPDKVPEAERIPPSFFTGKEEFPHFTNVAMEVGLDYMNLAGGAIADDFDNDGDIDLFLSGYGSNGQLEYFPNEGGRFEHRTKEAGLVGVYGGLNLIQADYDNDGYLDVYVPRGAWLSKIGLQPDSLLHNNGDGTFTDRAYDAGIAGVDYPNVTAVFSDYDNDGDLDIYLGNEEDENVKAPCQLFKNDGEGHFTDVAAPARVTNNRYTRGVIAGDYDGDGDPDLYVSNHNQENRLYRNNGDGTFEDVAPELGVTGPIRSYPAWFFDYNNDGILDLQVLAFGARPQDLAASALGQPFDADLPSLYIGDGKGGFKDIARESGLTEPFSVMGANVGDFDNDGYLDFYGGTGRPEARDLVPDKAYHNLRGKGYADVTIPSGLGNVQKGHGRAFADFDNDGDLDIVAQMGGAYRADLFHNALYENPGWGNHWLAVKLEGKESNRCALGAQIRADFVENGEKRSVYRTVSSGGSFGANPLRVHIGLGKAEKVDRLEVYWPKTGKKQIFHDVQCDQLLHIVEGSDKPMVIRLTALKLGSE